MNESQSKPASPPVAKEEDSRLSVTWLAFFIPMLMALVIYCFSPNFQERPFSRSDPFGGDFLQEWIGGKIVGGNPSMLYELEHAKDMQHVPKGLGFDWPEEKYFPMVYPPFYYMAMWPFSKLVYPEAVRCWLILSALIVSVCGFLLYEFYPRARYLLSVGLFLCIVFTPLLNCFSMGQKSTILLLILTGTFLLLHHRRPFSAGLVFGLIAFKPHLGILIGLTMLLKRHWSFAVGALSTVVMLVLSAWFYHPSLWPDYLHVVSNMGDYVQTGGYQLADSHSLWGAMQLTLGFLPPTLVKVGVGLMSLGVLYLLWRIVSPMVDVATPQFAVQFAAMVVATVILSPHFYTYDLTILLLPMLLITSSYDEGEWSKNTPGFAIGIILCVLFALNGLFGRVAGLIHVQPSIVLMLALLVLLGMKRIQSDERIVDTV